MSGNYEGYAVCYPEDVVEVDTTWTIIGPFSGATAADPKAQAVPRGGHYCVGIHVYFENASGAGQKAQAKLTWDTPGDIPLTNGEDCEEVELTYGETTATIGGVYFVGAKYIPPSPEQDARTAGYGPSVWLKLDAGTIDVVKVRYEFTEKR